ncbi:hypothetical protein DB42_BS00090 [Neochlamydia sp. EPS4]|nr:hypothetical protein DB42_BS00090 [Neochlamydia sp. EPS4]
MSFLSGRLLDIKACQKFLPFKIKILSILALFPLVNTIHTIFLLIKS